MMQTTSSIHTTPRSLHPYELSTSRELPLVGSSEPTSTMLSPDLGIPSQSTGVCLVVQVTGAANELDKRDVVKNPLHMTRSYAQVRRKLETGSTWPPRHATGNPHDISLHTARDHSRYTARNVPSWRASTYIWQNLLSGFLSGDICYRKGGGLEEVCVWMQDSQLPVRQGGIEM